MDNLIDEQIGLTHITGYTYRETLDTIAFAVIVRDAKRDRRYFFDSITELDAWMNDTLRTLKAA